MVIGRVLGRQRHQEATTAMDDLQTSDGSRGTVEYLAALRRRWAIVAAAVVIGGLGGFGLSLIQPKLYDSNTAVLVQATGAPDTTQLANSRTTGINLDTEAQIVKSQVVAAAAQKILKTSDPVGDLQSRVTVTVPPNTEVLTIAFQGATARAAQAGSQAFAQAYLDQRAAKATKDLSTQTTALRAQMASLNKELAAVSAQIAALPTNSVDRATATANQGILTNQITDIGNKLNPLLAVHVTPGAVISPATLAPKPSSPNLLLDLASGIFAGLLLGVAVALLLERADDRLRSAGDVHRHSDLPVLADIPGRQLTGAIAARGGEHAQHYGRLRNAVFSELGRTAALGKASNSKRSNVVLLLGAAPGKATGVVAANLCASLARPKHPVALLCADPDSSSPTVLGIGDRPGLAELLRFERDIGEVQHQSPVCPGVYVIGPGAALLADEDLVPDRLGDIVDALLAYSDYLIIETRPARSAADGQALAPLSAISLVVVELLRAKRPDLVEVTHEFDQVESPLTGVVVVPNVKSVLAARLAPVPNGAVRGGAPNAGYRPEARRPGPTPAGRAGVMPTPRGPASGP